MERIERIGPAAHEAAPVPAVPRLTVHEREEQARERERRQREQQEREQQQRRRTPEGGPEDPGERHIDVRA